MNVPKPVQDAGYAAVGFAVLAAQQVQLRRHQAVEQLIRQAPGAQGAVHDAVEQVMGLVGPAVEPLSRVPAAVGRAVEAGLGRLQALLPSSDPSG